MADEYGRERIRDAVEGLGEDGPVVGGEVTDRGLFGRHGRHHGYNSGYSEEDAFASELGGPYGRRPPPGAVVYEGEGGFGDGYGRRPPVMPYEGVGGGYGGGYGNEYPPDVAGGGYGRHGYAGEDYGRRPGPPMYVEAPVENSDLGTGLVDSNIRTEPDYGAGYGRPDGTSAYEVQGRHGGKHGHLSKEEREELEDERKHKHYAEAAAAAALGYGLYERHEKRDAEDRLEELGYDSDGKKKQGHHFFRSDS
uniref:Uncharacterized protein n=1 Tax=Physcomitrium patens TaxID=3218 RepID=A9S9J7_PHYPA|nr:hypothetical protein PHYPA_013644 [Physcomitrium patens]